MQILTTLISEERTERESGRTRFVAKPCCVGKYKRQNVRHTISYFLQLLNEYNYLKDLFECHNEIWLLSWNTWIITSYLIFNERCNEFGFPVFNTIASL